MFNLNLRLFDGEGAAAGAPAPENSTGAKETASAAGKLRANRNPLADVVYGRQEPEKHQDAAGEKRLRRRYMPVQTGQRSLKTSLRVIQRRV